MPTAPTYPGVYIEEVPSEVSTIIGVATSITAFIGRARRGPLNDPVRIQSFAEFQRRFGNLLRDSMLGYAVQHYFLNGGTDALVLRVAEGTNSTVFDLSAGGGNLQLVAANPGEWGDNLEIFVDHLTRDDTDTNLFNLTVREVDDNGVVQGVETFRNLSTEPDDQCFAQQVLVEMSDFVRVEGAIPADRPDQSPLNGDGNPLAAPITTNGTNGGSIGFSEIADPNLAADHEGIWALDHAALFNLLCIPPFQRETDVDERTWNAALAYCKSREAMLIVDPPRSWERPRDVLDATSGVDGTDRQVPARDENAALYFPRVRMVDPLQENRLDTFAPCGVVAGIYARTGAQRGVWKAPAGQEATLTGVCELADRLTDGENGQLNTHGVNCLRTFRSIGNVVWGARTLKGSDQLSYVYKYVPVRRLALFIKESLSRGTQWVVFEPNDEPLWAKIRLNVGAFMQNLFRQGAFQGQKPNDAYFVKCNG